MATDIALEHDVHEQDAAWQGGTEPFKASYGKLMMWYFLLSDAFTFAGFLIAYGTLRFSSPTWPLPDFVFASAPFIKAHAPLVFVTFMTFVLIASSVTMVRAVQEGHRGNKRGVVFWMLMTIIGGLIFLGSQAYEWTTLIKGENMSVNRNPFGKHSEEGVYLENEHGMPYKAGETPEKIGIDKGYLIHRMDLTAHEGAAHGGHGTTATTEHHEVPAGSFEAGTGPVDKDGFIHRAYKTNEGVVKRLEFGPRAFGALFFFITGFHGFHVLSGVAFLLIIMLNVASGLYHSRHNHYEMVEKIGLYWHFVDLVWVFVFLVFYLLS